nr:MAG TPA: hypothetical protein [Caudoviricetes sp.]
MGRLIDADKLIEWIKQQRKEVIEAQASGMYCRSITSEMFDTMKKDVDVFERKIKAEPTAYDPDKVVEQLEKNFNDPTQFCISHRESCGLFSHCDQCAFDSALYIVKGGGVDG